MHRGMEQECISTAERHCVKEVNMCRSLLAPVLALAALCPSGTRAQLPAAQTVTVELSSFKFTPSVLTLQHGTRYRLHLVNRAKGGHDFEARAFFENSTVAPQDQGKIERGKVDLGGGDIVDIRLVPNVAGSYRLRCTHFMHGAFGMKGTIVVQ
jgi:uncharacterized cupredoxin-like copper-binding protein